MKTFDHNAWRAANLNAEHGLIVEYLPAEQQILERKKYHIAGSWYGCRLGGCVSWKPWKIKQPLEVLLENPTHLIGRCIMCREFMEFDRTVVEETGLNVSAWQVCSKDAVFPRDFPELIELHDQMYRMAIKNPPQWVRAAEFFGREIEEPE